MNFIDKIPEKISAKEIIGFSKDDSIILLRDSLNQHKKDMRKLLESQMNFPAFVSIMTAVEIYLKIHLTTFCFIHVKNFSHSQKKQIEILTGDKKLLNNFQYSVKSKYSHNIIELIEDLQYLIEQKPPELNQLKSSVSNLIAKDWATKRYDTESIIYESEKIRNIYTSFNTFIKWMQENGLEILDKVEN